MTKNINIPATPSDLTEKAKYTIDNLWPSKLKEPYDKVYTQFMHWGEKMALIHFLYMEPNLNKKANILLFCIGPILFVHK